MLHIGNPEVDSVAHYNFPARPTERYGVHDRLTLTPGQLVRYGEYWEGDECVIEAEGRVVQAQTYGEHLVLTRRYRARLGESRFYLRDHIVNAGFLPTVHMLLYHINVGFPVVDEGAELIAPFGGAPAIPSGLPSTGPVDMSNDYRRFIAPQKNWLLQGFEHKLRADATGYVPVSVVNSRLGDGGLGVYVVYRQRELPKYLEWRMMGEGQYAVGIEPSTNTFGRQKAREASELIVLQPGEEREYELEVGVLDGLEAIRSFRTRVQQIPGAE
jgi:hypothetical protein